MLVLQPPIVSQDKINWQILNRYKLVDFRPDPFSDWLWPSQNLKIN